MKMRTALVLAALLLLTLVLPAWAQGPPMTQGQAIRHDGCSPKAQNS